MLARLCWLTEFITALVSRWRDYCLSSALIPVEISHLRLSETNRVHVNHSLSASSELATALQDNLVGYRACPLLRHTFFCFFFLSTPLIKTRLNLVRHRTIPVCLPGPRGVWRLWHGRRVVSGFILHHLLVYQFLPLIYCVLSLVYTVIIRTWCWLQKSNFIFRFCSFNQI